MKLEDLLRMRSVLNGYLEYIPEEVDVVDYLQVIVDLSMEIDRNIKEVSDGDPGKSNK